MIPWNDGELMAKMLAACLLDRSKADVDVLARVKGLLGLPADVSDRVAGTAIAALSLGQEDCVGNTAWQVEGARGDWVWMQDPDCDARVDDCANRMRHVFVPGNRTLCLADRSCNWNRWDAAMTPEKCVSETRPDVCMECWGDPANGDCWLQTQWSRCMKNDYWEKATSPSDVLALTAPAPLFAARCRANLACRLSSFLLALCAALPAKHSMPSAYMAPVPTSTATVLTTMTPSQR